MSDAEDILHRVKRLNADLRQYHAAYERGHAVMDEAGTPLRSPSYDRRRSGKPESRTPTAADPDLRTFLILSTQRLADAVRLLVPLSESDGWEPPGLAKTYPLIRDKGRTIVELTSCDVAGRVEWKDADEPTTPCMSPYEVSQGVSVARGLFGAVEAQWDDLDDGDRDTVQDAVREAEEAVKHLRVRARVWSRPRVDAPPRVCSRQGCWKEVVNRAGDVCVSCTSREYRERKKAS